MLRIVATGWKVKVLELRMFDHFGAPMIPSRRIVFRPQIWLRFSFLNSVIMRTGHG